MEIEYVEKHKIFETVVGSRAYGTFVETSDFDKGGVMIPGPEYFFGIRRFEQFQGYPGEDRTIYDIRKALMLIADNNPNMMDFLWVPEHCIQLMTPYWEKILDHREKFLSKKCRYTFSGYAFAQLDRIRTHRKFLLNPPKGEPKRTDYGLPEQAMFPTMQIKAVCAAAMEYIVEEERQSFIDELDRIYGDYVVPLLARFIVPEERALAMEWLQIGIKSQAKAFISIGNHLLKEEYLDIAHKELQYYNAANEWRRYKEWSKSRNKKRAVLEEKFGFDCKHAMHLVRLIKMCKEILETGKVNVDRTNIDAEELKAIRDGAMKYEEVEAYAHSMDNQFNALYLTTKLPRSVDTDFVSDLCVSVCQDFFRDKYPS